MQPPMPLPSAPAYISPGQYQHGSNVNPYGSLESLTNNNQRQVAIDNNSQSIANNNEESNNTLQSIADNNEESEDNNSQFIANSSEASFKDNNSQSIANNDKESIQDNSLQSRLVALRPRQLIEAQMAADQEAVRVNQQHELDQHNQRRDNKSKPAENDGSVLRKLSFSENPPEVRLIPNDDDNSSNGSHGDDERPLTKTSLFQQFKNYFYNRWTGNKQSRSSLSTENQVLQDKQTFNRLLIKYDHSSPTTSEELLDANHPYFVKAAQLDQKRNILETRLTEINQDLAKLVDLENNIKLQAKTCAQIDLNTSLTYLQDEYKNLTNEVETILTNKVRQFTILKTLFYVSLFIGSYYILKSFNLNPLRYIGFALDYLLTSVKTKYDLDTNSKVSKKIDILKALHKVHSNNESMINASSAVELARVIKNKNK